MAVLAIAVATLLSSSLFSGRILAAEDVLMFQSPFAPALAPHSPPSNQFLFDTFYQLHPDMLFARDALRHGHLPTWNPYQGGGDPLLASQQHAMLSPLNWLLTIAPFWQSLEWVAALKLLLAGLGLFLLLVTLGLRRSAALLGATAFMLSAPLIDWLSHPHANVYVMMPWLLLACERLARSNAWRDALWVALAVGFVVLGGHPPSMVIVASVAVPWVAYRLTAARGNSRRPIAGKLVAGVALGLCLGAIVELPLIELSGQSYQISRSQGGGPKTILFGFVAPELWGRPDKFEIGGGPLNYLERTGYLGVLPLLFAGVGFVRRPRGPQVFFAVAGLIALALVVKLPLLTSLFSGLPGLDQINRMRYLVVCALAGAVLAAYGLDAVMGLDTRRRGLVAVGTAAAIGVLPLAWVVKHSDVLDSSGRSVHHVLGIGHSALSRPELQLAVFMRWALFAAIGVALIAAVVARPRTAAWVAVLAVAVTAFDLVAFERGFQPAIPLAEADPPTPPAITFLQARQGHGRVGGQQELGPNVAERYRLRDARIYRSPPLERRGLLWAALGGTGTDYEIMPAAAQRVADFYAVGHQLSYGLTANGAGRWKRAGVEPVVKNRKTLPRAWVAYRWQSARDLEDAVAKLAAGGSEPVIENVTAASGATTSNTGSARFIRDENAHVTLAVDARQPGQLILADTFYPGWKAKVDGHETAIHPANAAFRAVSVPAGRHTVSFDYSPRSIRIGLILSVLAALVLLGGFVATGGWRPLHRRAARTRPAAAPATKARRAPAGR